MKDFIAKKPFLFTLLVLGAASVLISIIQIIVAAASKLTFYTIWGGLNLLIVLVIFVLAWIFRKIANK